MSPLDSPYIDPSVDTFRNRARQATGLRARRGRQGARSRPSRPRIARSCCSCDEAADRRPCAGPDHDVARGGGVRQPGRCAWKWTLLQLRPRERHRAAADGGGVQRHAAACRQAATTCRRRPQPVRPEPRRCGAMGKAHEQWVAGQRPGRLGEGRPGGAAGYQIVHFWLKALRTSAPIRPARGSWPRYGPTTATTTSSAVRSPS